MSDYIKREDAIEAFDPQQRRDWYTPWIVETLEDLPSADVAPARHGHWIDDAGALRCSECGVSFPDLHPLYENAAYCPNCGARMDERRDDEID